MSDIHPSCVRKTCVAADGLCDVPAALAGVRTSIDELDSIAGRLARSAVAHGGSWDDVGGRLRIDRKRAKAAYGRSLAEGD